MWTVSLGLALVSPALAAPVQLAHQARLVDAAGAPLNGAVSIRASLWDAAEGGAERWAEGHSTTAADGYVALVLGAGGTLDDGLFLTHDDLWLELALGAPPVALGPRARLVSVPRAIRAATADNVDLGGGAVFDPITGALDAGGSVRVGADARTCAPGLTGTLRWHANRLELCTGLAWVSVASSRDGSSSGAAAGSCLALATDFPNLPSGAYWIDPDGDIGLDPFQAWCDLTPGDAGWTLVAIANSAAQPAVDTAFTPTSDGVGNYVKPLRGGAGTESRFECGATGTGVIGTQRNRGTWTWGGTQISASLGTLVSDNVVWPADLPGYNSPDAGDPWGNHIGGVHFPNFGHTGFHHVDGQTFRSGVFTCNPQSSAYGTGDTAWVATSGTRYVRYWLR
jgi:hypothetical protein